MAPDTLSLAREIWDYHHLNHKLEKSDGIVALGSHDLRVADRAAQLFLEGYAPWLLFSGGLGNLTAGVWAQPEAVLFAQRARKLGVPPEHIYVEPDSTNTGENIQFSDQLITKNHLPAQKLILVQKPYMERRTYATARIYWPHKELTVTSQPVSFDDYPTPQIERDEVIRIMVADLQRIRLYPERGFQIPQPMPDKIWQACLTLIEQGYDDYLITD